MQYVRLIVTRLRRYASGDGFEVYGDSGTGVIDYVTPLTPRRVLFWREAGPRAGHLLDGHLALRHLDSTRPDTHLQGVHLLDEHLRPAAGMTFDAGPYYFGRFKHVVRVFDEAGNMDTTGEAITEAVVNSFPRAPQCLRPEAFDAGRIRFSFVGSEELSA